MLIAAAGMSNGDLHVVVTRDDENDVWHNIRYADGSWSGFNSVGGPSGFKAIGCTSDGSSLALFATQDPTCVSWDYSDGFDNDKYYLWDRPRPVGGVVGIRCRRQYPTV